MLERVAEAAHRDDEWEEMVHSFVQVKAARFGSLSPDGQHKIYADFQQLLEPQLERLLESLRLPPDDFLVSLIGADPHALPTRPGVHGERAAAIEVCALDSEQLFHELMEAEAAEQAASAVRKMALHLTGDTDWKCVVGGFIEEHADKFEGLDATDGHSQLEHTALHEEYQGLLEEELERIIGELSLDAEDALVALASFDPSTQRPSATPLPRGPLGELRGFVEYTDFKRMMVAAALENLAI